MATRRLSKAATAIWYRVTIRSAVVYAFQLFRFPHAVGGEIYINILNVRYSHVISGKMSFIGEIGPQYTDLALRRSAEAMVADWRGRCCAINFTHSYVSASYEKFTLAGVGFLCGSQHAGGGSHVFDAPSDEPTSSDGRRLLA